MYLYLTQHFFLSLKFNGIEHYQNKSRIQSDKVKEELCKLKQIKMITLPNHYAKHYEFIRELIKKFNGDVYQKTLFDY